MVNRPPEDQPLKKSVMKEQKVIPSTHMLKQLCTLTYVQMLTLFSEKQCVKRFCFQVLTQPDCWLSPLRWTGNKIWEDWEDTLRFWWWFGIGIGRGSTLWGRIQQAWLWSMKGEEFLGVVLMLPPSVVYIRVAHTCANDGLSESKLLHMRGRMDIFVL